MTGYSLVSYPDSPEIEKGTLLFESDRNHIRVAQWIPQQRNLTYKTILKIGKGEGHVSPEILGFDEVYF